jgi:hypothetical protein
MPEGAAIRDAFLADERATLVALASQITQTDADVRAIGAQARAWVEAVRAANVGRRAASSRFCSSTTCRHPKACC